MSNEQMKTEIETLETLLQQKEELEKKIAQTKKTERNKCIKNIVADMAKFNITIQDLEGALNKKNNAAIRFINPETGATWAGIGKRPKWIVEAEKAGKNIEDFAVK